MIDFWTGWQRDANLRAFREERDTCVIMISLKAGGEGLNLQEADHIFIVDPWYDKVIVLRSLLAGSSERRASAGGTRRPSCRPSTARTASGRPRQSLPFASSSKVPSRYRILPGGRACATGVTRMLHACTHAQPWTLDETKSALPSQANKAPEGIADG